MNLKIWIWLSVAILALASGGCEVSKSVSGRNVSHLYAQSGETQVGLQYKVLNNGDGTAKLIWKLDPNTVGVGKNEQGKDYLGFSFRYQVYTSYSESTPLDSGALIEKEWVINNNTPIVHHIDLKLPVNRNVLVDITFRDFNSMKVDRQYLDVYGASAFSSQSFSLLTSKNELIFEPYVIKSDSYIIQTVKPTGSLFVKLYDREFSQASAPFAIVSPKPFNFTPDDQERVKKLDDTHFIVYIVKKGFYQIVTDSNSKNGGTIYHFGDYYPNAKTVNDLLLPLRYITSTDEFNGMAQGNNIKRNVDAYWLKVGGNPDRARQLIGAYYSRVEHANRFFHSYLEGWKSDRGMCYIVFGPPTVVYRSTSSETWVYGEEGKYNALSLTFTRVVNPFTGNDFRLNRSGTLKTPWYRAVEFWRQGRVLSYQ